MSTEGLNDMVGLRCLVRTDTAGVWFGLVSAKAGREVIIVNARRLWYWQAEQSISLSGVALYGVDQSKSLIVAPVPSVWVEAIEIIPCTDVACISLVSAPHAQATLRDQQGYGKGLGTGGGFPEGDGHGDGCGDGDGNERGSGCA